MAWYDNDPSKAQEVLSGLNAKRRQFGQGDLSAAEIDEAKGVLGGEAFDESKLQGLYKRIESGAPSGWGQPAAPPASTGGNPAWGIGPRATPPVVTQNGVPQEVPTSGVPSMWNPPAPAERLYSPGPSTLAPAAPSSAPAANPWTAPPAAAAPDAPAGPVLEPPPTSLVRTTQGVKELGGQAGELYSFLMDRARQRLDVDKNNPLIRDQVDALRAEQTRSSRQYLQKLAEQRGANTNIGAETRASEEKIGQNTGAFQAGLIAQEIGARRTEIQQALNGATGLLNEQQRMQLQEELANLEAAERQYEFRASQAEGARQFDTNTLTGREQFLSTLMNNQDQFGQTMKQRGYEFDTGQASDLLKSNKSLSLQEALAQLALSQRAYEFDTTQQYLNSPLGR